MSGSLDHRPSVWPGRNGLLGALARAWPDVGLQGGIRERVRDPIKRAGPVVTARGRELTSDTSGDVGTCSAIDPDTSSSRGRSQTDALRIAAWALVNVALVLWPVTIALLFMPHDWQIWEQVPERLATGELYTEEPGTYLFYFAPAMAWLLSAVVPLGYSLWWALHLGVLPLLRDWRLIALALLSVPVWLDMMMAGLIVFVFVAGVLALRGSYAGGLVYLTLSLLMPRPLQLPLVVWLLWQRPSLRWPFVAMVSVLAATTIGSGYAADWVIALLDLGRKHTEWPSNLSPSRFLGLAWYPLGFALAAWLTLRGRVGFAALAISPYLPPSYLLLLLWEVSRAPEAWNRGPPAGGAARR